MKDIPKGSEWVCIYTWNQLVSSGPPSARPARHAYKESAQAGRPLWRGHLAPRLDNTSPPRL